MFRSSFPELLWKPSLRQTGCLSPHLQIVCGNMVLYSHFRAACWIFRPLTLLFLQEFLKFFSLLVTILNLKN